MRSVLSILEGYAPEDRTDDSPPFKCEICKKWFKRTSALKCLVIHPDGACCHFGCSPIPRPFHDLDLMEVLEIASGLRENPE